MSLKIGIVAGEVSGDYLGAGLMQAIRQRAPETHFVGIGGERMLAAGLECWAPLERLSVIGLTEAIARVPGLIRLRRRLARAFKAAGVDLLIGVDAPDFNLGLERLAHARGVRTIHYVSPQVWAWRPGRVRSMRLGIDRVLCLYPFEPEFYARHGLDARFVGHPLADEIALDVPAAPARKTLGLQAGGPIVALLPGSRRSEVSRHADPFLGAARHVKSRLPDVEAAVPAATPEIATLLRERLTAEDREWIRIFPGRSREVLAAADVVLTASGTATLETTLTGRPMVVGYQVSALSYFMLRRLIRVPYVAQPNLLAGRELVPELIQGQMTPERLGEAMLALLRDPDRDARLRDSFRQIHETLRQDADSRAAEAVLELTG